MYPQNIGPGTRFFFFNSLLRSSEINPDEAAPVLDAARSVIFGGGTDIEQKAHQDNVMSTIMGAITFLESMAAFEAQNERAAFEQQLLPLINSDEKYASFADIYNDKEHTVDYPRLLTFINLINQDTQIARAMIQDYTESVENFNKAAQKIISEKKYNFTDIERHRGQIVEDARILASDMDKKITSTMAEIGAAIKRDITGTDKTVAAKGRKLIEENVLSMLQNNQTQIQLSSDATIGLTSLLMSKLREIASVNKDVQGTDKQLTALFEKIEGSKNEEQKITAQLTQEYQSLLEQMNIVETRGQQVQQLLNRKIKHGVHIQGNRIIGLTGRNRDKIKRFLEKTNKDKIDLSRLVDQKFGAQESSKNILNAQTNQLYVEKLRERLNIQGASLEEVAIKINEILALMSSSVRKESITIMTESRSANKLYGLIPEDTIKGIVLDAFQNGKNDATMFFLGKAMYDSGLDTDKITNTLMTKINQFSTLYREEVKALGQKNTRGSFNARAQETAVKKMDTSIIKALQDEMEQELTPEQIKDIFIVDSSVKFAETFIADEGGFHGGSLGGDVEQQIDNINYMLETGGITPLDAQWLITATLNAGDGMIGSSQRPSLENYFSTVAAMLMFRTGANTIEQWTKQIQPGSSPTKIHIYTFGPVFVPQSYILQKTAEGLRQCVNLIETEASNNGSRAHIYNPVSVSKIIRNDWEATATNNYKSVKIQLTLLGGLLDMLHQMEDIMNHLSF